MKALRYVCLKPIFLFCFTQSSGPQRREVMFCQSLAQEILLETHITTKQQFASQAHFADVLLDSYGL